jgi:thymidine kinase
VEDGTKKNCGTNVDLLRYVDRRFEDFAKQMDERFRSQEVASRAAADSNARAFDKVNEFRAAMQDASERYADRGTWRGSVSGCW